MPIFTHIFHFVLFCSIPDPPPCVIKNYLSYLYWGIFIAFAIVVANRFKLRVMSLINCLRNTNSEEERDAGMRSRSNLEFSNISKQIPSLVHRIHNVEHPCCAMPQSPRLVRSGGMRRDWSFEDLRRAIEGWSGKSVDGLVRVTLIWIFYCNSGIYWIIIFPNHHLLLWKNFIIPSFENIVNDNHSLI